jgi:PAS domain S-box-containing protein
VTFARGSIVQNIVLQFEGHEREIALRESESKYSSIVEQAEDAIISVDEEQRITLFNPAAEKTFGYSHKEILGSYIGKLIPERYQKLHQGAVDWFSDADASKAIRRESDVAALRRNGDEFPIEVAISRQKLSGSDIMTITIRDITERVKAEESVRQLSQAIEHAGESILITDRDGLIEYANPAFTKITGYTSEEVIGREPNILRGGNQDAAFYEDIWKTAKSGHVWHGKVVGRKKDGSFYPSMLTISPIYDQVGDVTNYSHFVGIQSDLTELVEMENKLQEAQKMEALGTLVGGIAHEFNNMLAGMTGNLYLAKLRTQEMPDVVEKLEIIESISFRAADMIQKLLTFARKDMVSMREIQLNLFIKEAIGFFRTTVPENIDIHVEICKDLLLINGDNTKLHQVLLNLISNACDALEGKSDPRITIGLDAFHPDDSFIETHPYFTAGSYAHLSVRDNGCGISEHQIKHMFEPFFTTKELGKGTGLGLSMVFGAVKSHRGFAEVESIEGEGSTFHIYLPLLEPKEITSVLPQEEVIEKGHGEVILLVDDEQTVIETGKKVLEALGYQVMTAENGQQAIEIFEAHSEEIALCILDVVMPVMNGDKAAQCIRQSNPEVKVIFSTGYDKSLLTNIENEIVLNKPFSIVEMSRLVRKQIES